MAFSEDGAVTAFIGIRKLKWIRSLCFCIDGNCLREDVPDDVACIVVMMALVTVTVQVNGEAVVQDALALVTLREFLSAFAQELRELPSSPSITFDCHR